MKRFPTRGTLFLLALLTAPLLIGPTPALAQDDPEPSSEAEPGSDPEAEAEEPEEDRVSLDVALGAARGGGRAKVSAGELDYQPDLYVVAGGGVKILYRDLELSADRVRLDIPTNRVTAEGNVVLDEGPQRMTGSRLEYDLDNRTGRVTQATAFVDPEIYFSGDEIVKTGDVTYTVEDGVFTSCAGDVPAWSIALSSADITLEDYARIRNARMKFKRAPVFYLPYIVWPATTERKSGFLIPKPGYSDRRGLYLNLAYYKTLGRSADATIFTDLSTENYFGVGAELRYRPSAQTTGKIETYFLSDPDDIFVELNQNDQPVRFDPNLESGDDRWKFRYFHETKDLWGGWRGVVNLQLYSDFDYLKDIERSVERQTRSVLGSNAFLSRNIGQHSFNVMVDQLERIQSNQGTATLRQLPELEYRLRPIQLGDTPMYFSMQSSAHYFSADFEDPPLEDGTVETTTLEYGRVDFAPSLSIPLGNLPWLNVKATLGGRVTHYTDSVPEVEDTDLVTNDDDPLGGGGLTRAFPTARVEIVGPTVSRIFDSSGDGRFAKFKHIVEPRFTYTWVDEFDDEDLVPIFDEIDIVQPLNVGVVSLVNRLLAKPADEEEGGAFEIASLEIAQGYLFDDFNDEILNPAGEVDKGPVVVELRVNPSRETSFKTDLQYDTDESQLTSLSLSGGTQVFGRHNVGLTWYTRWNAMTGDEISDQLRLFTRFELLPERLYFDAQASLDLRDDLPETDPEILNQRYLFDYRGSCYSWLLEYREVNYLNFEDSEVRFSLSLKNVGTFLDLNESLN
ncbi:MAG: LPS assembly protein LptD [Acidobacteriota bacterium]